MKTILPFIELGWYTVPLDGVIVREPATGKKKLPPFPTNWKATFVPQQYLPADGEAVPLTGAVITGTQSGIISIDCDNSHTANLFRSLDPDYDFVFYSLGKEGCSIIYRYNKLSHLQPFALHNDNIQLDFLTNERLQFLPSSGNRSKVEWTAESLEQLPLLKDPPSAIITLLNVLAQKQATAGKDAVVESARTVYYKHLAPFLESWLSTKKFNPELFRILTPKDPSFRALDQYVREKTLHPDNVPQGMGNAYLASVAGVLACDVSVSATLFRKALLAINDMWSQPYSQKDITEFINYQLQRDVFTYDEAWEDSISVVLTAYNTVVEAWYDPFSQLYYALDSHLGLTTFNAPDALTKHLNSIIFGRTYSNAEMYSFLQKKEVTVSPLQPAGALDGYLLKRYNLFTRSKAYDVLLNPTNYTGQYPDPWVTRMFFEHLIPDTGTREYVLRFLLRKLTTLEFSEVILYLLGTQGAGKNVLVNWLAQLTSNLSTQNDDFALTIEADLENFIGKYNSWLKHALFVNLDEFGEKTRSSAEDRQVLAQLKSYSGKNMFQLRAMHSNPTGATHSATFILTANKNTLALDLEDRRIVLIETPKPLTQSALATKFKDKAELIKALFAEQEAWSYYWALNYTGMEEGEYRTPINTKAKQEFIYKYMTPARKIVAYIQSEDAQRLFVMADEVGLSQDFINHAKHGKIAKQLLIDMCDAYSNAQGKSSPLLFALRDANIEPVQIRIGDWRGYGYNLPFLKDFALKYIMNGGNLLAVE
jgi:hypothetical protein